MLVKEFTPERPFLGQWLPFWALFDAVFGHMFAAKRVKSALRRPFSRSRMVALGVPQHSIRLSGQMVVL